MKKVYQTVVLDSWQMDLSPQGEVGFKVIVSPYRICELPDGGVGYESTSGTIKRTLPLTAHLSEASAKQEAIDILNARAAVLKMQISNLRTEILNETR